MAEPVHPASTTPRVRGRPALAVALSHVEHLVGPRLERLLELARACDEAGVDQLVLSEHLALARVIVGHPGVGTSVFPFPGTEQYPEPLVTLAAFASITSRARLSTNILVAPLRPAVLLAKMVATLACLSGGRLDLAVGSGWHAEEFAALGVPLQGRVARLDDTIRACKALWRDQPASFSSPTVSFEEMYCCPGPPGGDVPVWFGGEENRAVARRIAELGAGWSIMGGSDAVRVAKGAELIAEECVRIGRDPASVGIRVSLSPPALPTVRERIDALLDQVPALVDAGTTIVQVGLPQFVDRAEATSEVMDQLVAAFETLRT